MLKSIFYKIMSDEQQRQKMNSLEDKNQIYKLFCQNGYTKSYDEFEKEMEIFLNSDDSKKFLNNDFGELSDEVLEMIAGGVNVKRAVTASIATLLTTFTVGAIGNQILPQSNTDNTSSPTQTISTFDNSRKDAKQTQDDNDKQPQDDNGGGSGPADHRGMGPNGGSGPAAHPINNTQIFANQENKKESSNQNRDGEFRIVEHKQSLTTLHKKENKENKEESSNTQQSLQNLTQLMQEHNQKADEYIKVKRNAPENLKSIYDKLAATETEAYNTLARLYKAQQAQKSGELNILNQHRNQQNIQDCESIYNTLVNRINQLKSQLQNTENQTTQQQENKEELSNTQQNIQQQNLQDLNQKMQEHNQKADEYIKVKRNAPENLKSIYNKLAATETEAYNTLARLYKAQQAQKSGELNILNQHRNQQNIQDCESIYNTLVNRINQLKSQLQNTENQTTQQQENKYNKELQTIQTVVKNEDNKQKSSEIQQKKPISWEINDIKDNKKNKAKSKVQQRLEKDKKQRELKKENEDNKQKSSEIQHEDQ